MSEFDNAKLKDSESVDQKVLARDISSKIPYEFFDYILVKPLDSVKVKKTFTKPKEKGETEDENGITATDYDDVTTEVKEVDSDYRKGVVLKMPTCSQDTKFSETIEIGTVIIFRDRSCVFFDLLKDSRLVRLYDVIAIEK